jgi:hypothetical protein
VPVRLHADAAAARVDCAELSEVSAAVAMVMRRADRAPAPWDAGALDQMVTDGSRTAADRTYGRGEGLLVIDQIAGHPAHHPGIQRIAQERG